MDASVLMGKLAPFQNKRTMLVDDQSTGDIISAIISAHKAHAKDYAQIAPYFNAYSKKEVGRKIFNFLKNNINYSIEPGSRQTVTSPASLLALGKGDCKHYSLFTAGILQQLRIPFAFRFASYRVWDKTPQHVFVVINPGTNSEIWVDPVLSEFDYKKPYYYATDKKMALYSISGIGATAQQKAALKAAKGAKKAAPTKEQKAAAKKEVKAARVAAGRTAGQVLKKGTKVVLKVAAAPVRNSFLLLVTINFGALATKLEKAWQTNPTKITNFWEGAGGKIDALKKAWEKGAKKKRIFGQDSYIGVAPAAAAATAAPLLVKVADVLKSIGIDPAELVQIGKDALNQKAQELAKKALEPKAAKEAVNVDVADQVFPDETAAPSEQITAEQAKTVQTVTPAPNYLPLIIGGAAVIYFITKKR